ncbi:GNAT family N-acetyltransferase [Streptomyces sp. NPDC003077]|uniref:GNAT family N-acetyltransferase n=1 Tax=Streptomyces sp. NPDC003077 TaxID=3154443 RepID=UPI0033A7D4DB
MPIRAARPDEAERLTELALRSKAYWGYDPAFMEACGEELTLREADVEPCRTHVYERDGRLLGLVTLEGEPPEGVLGMCFVEPSAIGQGIGRRLMEHARSQARRLGFDRLSIDADPNALPFYLAMGAVQVGTAPSGSIPGRELPRLSLAVAPGTG